MSLQNLVPLNAPRPYEQIIAIDIETGSEGELLDIGVAYQDKVVFFQKWDDFFKWLLGVGQDTRVVAHNGFGFDYIGFVQWLLLHYKDYDLTDNDVTFLSSESCIVALVIHVCEVKYTFIDTTRFFPGMSLEVIGQSMFNEGKHDIPDEYKSSMEKFKKRFRKRYYAYLQQDCELLLAIYVTLRDKINEIQDIGELGLSSGSTAMRGFRRWLYKHDSEMFVFAAPFELLGAADRCLRGGLTLYIGDGEEIEAYTYESVNSYDVISMYPSIQRFIPVPTSPMVQVNEIIIDSDDRVRPGWYYCEFEQLQGRIPVLYDVDNIDRYRINNRGNASKVENPVFKGVGLLSHFEIEFLRQYGRIGQVYDGVIYEDYSFPFREFMDSGLALRLAAKANNESALVLAIKIFLNSLYGKFAQSINIEQMAITGNVDWYETQIQAEIASNGLTDIIEYYFSDDVVLYGTPSESTGFSNRFIGGMITSLARLKLGLVYNTVHSIYCDTDSIFTQDIIDPRLVGKRAGDFELKDHSKTMLCFGKKSYRYGDDTVWKGIPKNTLTSADLEAIRSGETATTIYNRPTAFKTAMKTKIANPNKFIKRHRKVKAGKSLRMLSYLRQEKSLLDIEKVRSLLDKLMPTM